MTATFPDHTRAILEQWAGSRVIDSARLRTRAWLVLETLHRRGGLDLAQATVGSAQAAKWLMDFHNMGLVGLMETPRTGRPRKTVAERSASAQWRDSRLDGRTELLALQRNHRRTTPICTFAPLVQMAGMFVCKGLAVLVFTEADLERHEDLQGDWVDVSSANKGASRLDRENSPNLLDALRAARHRAKPPGKRPLVEQRIRFVSRLHDLCCRYRGKVDVVVSASPQEPQLRELLVEFRKAQIWQHQSSLAPGLLRRLAFHAAVPVERDLADFITPFFGKPASSHQGPGSRVRSLCTELKDFAGGVLEWHRRADAANESTAW